MDREFLSKHSLKVVHEFTTVHPEWSCVHEGAICAEPDGQLRVVLTDHGLPRFGTERDLQLQILKCKTLFLDLSKAVELLS